MLIPKGTTMGATIYKMTIKKNGVSMIIDARKGNNTSVMFYLNTKRYAPEGILALNNIPEEN